MRPQFKRRAAFKQSPVTGMFEFVQSVTMYYVRMLFSYTVIGTLVGIVLVSVFSILLLRVTLQRKLENDWGTYITSVISAVQIAVMSFVYKLLARKLTEFGMFSRTSLSLPLLSLAPLSCCVVHCRVGRVVRVPGALWVRGEYAVGVLRMRYGGTLSISFLLLCPFALAPSFLCSSCGAAPGR